MSVVQEKQYLSTQTNLCTVSRTAEKARNSAFNDTKAIFNSLENHGEISI